MLPPSSKRKWWERGRVHTYPTFDNKLNCAIELYYTHRDDGNLAAPEHRFSEWRHPMGPLEHWPSELVEALLREKCVTPTMLMHGDPRFPDTGCWIAMREGTEILRVSSKTVYDSGFSVDTDTVQLQLSKAKHAHAEALAKREQSAKAKIEQLQVDQQEHLRPWAEGLARAAAAAVADAAAADALEYSGENTNDEVRTPNYMEMLCRREAPAPGWMARLTERNRRSNHRMRLWDKVCGSNTTRATESAKRLRCSGSPAAERLHCSGSPYYTSASGCCFHGCAPNSHPGHPLTPASWFVHRTPLPPMLTATTTAQGR
jgi:hypothetical protein